MNPSPFANNKPNAVVFAPDLSLYAKNDSGTQWLIMRAMNDGSRDVLVRAIPCAGTDVLIFSNPAPSPSNFAKAYSVAVTTLFNNGVQGNSLVYDLSSNNAPCSLPFALLAFTGSGCTALGTFVRQSTDAWFSEVVFPASGSTHRCWANPTTLHTAHASPSCVVLMDNSPDNSVYGVYIIKEDQSRCKLTADGYWMSLLAIPKDTTYACSVNGTDGESILVYTTNKPNPVAYLSTPQVNGGSPLKLSNWGQSLPAGSTLVSGQVLFRQAGNLASSPYIVALVASAMNGSLAPYAFDAASNYGTATRLQTLRDTSSASISDGSCACHCMKARQSPPQPQQQPSYSYYYQGTGQQSNPAEAGTALTSANQVALSDWEPKVAAFLTDYSIPQALGRAIVDYLY